MQHKTNKLEKFFLWFCIVDVLFLTYLPFIAMSASFVVIAIWMILNMKIVTRSLKGTQWVAFVILAIVSTLFGILSYPLMAYTFVKNTFIFLMSTFYYFYFRESLAENKNVRLQTIYTVLYLFVAVGAILALVYLAIPSIFVSIKGVLNKYDGVASSYALGETLDEIRYNFLWTDANNVAYMFSAVTLFLFRYGKNGLVKNAILFSLNTIILIATMSTGGITAFAIGFICFLVVSFKRVIRIKTKDFILIFLFTIAFVVVGVSTVDSIISNNNIVAASIERVSGNSMDSRVQRWTYILENTNIFEYVLVGKGPGIIISNVVKQPHSGVLYMIYSYGMVSLLIFTKIFFLKKKYIAIKNYVFMIPISIGFLINTLITNPKIMGIICLLVVLLEYSADADLEVEVIGV